MARKKRSTAAGSAFEEAQNALGIPARQKGKPRGLPFQKANRFGLETRWKRGQTGNPEGRACTASEFKQKCRDVALDSLDFLYGVMTGEVPMVSAARIRAAEDFVDWAQFPRATRKIAGDDDEAPLKVGASDQLMTFLKKVAGESEEE